MAGTKNAYPSSWTLRRTRLCFSNTWPIKLGNQYRGVWFTLPTYTYTCTSCNDLIERRQSFSDPPLTTCEQCGGSLRKVFHPVGIVFKGSGWYVTDSRSASSTSVSSTARNGEGSGEAAKKTEKGETAASSSASASSSSEPSKPAAASATPASKD
jgi:putative FmdB family regulatory protein